ncbi:MAG TPA: TIGR02186 family protein [Pseudolabrys sp.]|nr:TIGR02186 family protein [Pseudolabrys sp.]
MKWIAAILVALACCAPAAAQERLVISLSNQRVAITSNFAGEHLVLFGTVQRGAGAPPRDRGYDIVVTVTGPKQTLRTRRKTRVLGVWVNVDSRDFVGVPGYLAVLSNRPVNEIADREILRRLQIGLDNFILRQHIGPDFADTVPDDPFRVAFVRLESERGLYAQDADAVTFLTPDVFRASIPLPSNVPTGDYNVDVKLFADGKMAAHTNTGLDVIKVGFEQYVADAARDYGLLYGTATMLMALMTGWIASVLFRRD